MGTVCQAVLPSTFSPGQTRQSIFSTLPLPTQPDIVYIPTVPRHGALARVAGASLLQFHEEMKASHTVQSSETKANEGLTRLGQLGKEEGAESARDVLEE